MESSSPRNPLLLTLTLPIFLLLLPSPFAAALAPIAPLTHHGGPLLKGNLNIALIWYGQFGRTQKNAVRHFLDSLNSVTDFKPQVSEWWRAVESYGGGPGAGIRVNVVKQVTDPNYSVGKIITTDYIPGLIKEATGGDKSVLTVILTGRMVTVQGLCMGKCSLHGVVRATNQPYLLVMNPESECPGACAFPFHHRDGKATEPTLLPPSGNVGADALVMSLATALAGTVTNPMNTAYYLGSPSDPLEAVTACAGEYGKDPFQGYTGRVQFDRSGAAFNAYGVHGVKFLLPAVWNPATKTCL